MIEVKENGKYFDVIITHFDLHACTPVNPKPFSKALAKSVNTGKPGLVHTGRVKKSVDKSPKFVLPLDISKYKGKKIRFILPEGGAPIFAGKDVKEKIAAREKEIRTLIKN